MTREEQFAKSFEANRSDKSIHGYASVYASLPEDIQSIFEVGVYWGGSLLTWQEMFPSAKEIVGMDINLQLLFDAESQWMKKRELNFQIQVIQRDLREDFTLGLPDFDLVIDDATHETDHILHIWNLMHKKARKFYIIEDVYLSRMMTIWHQIIKDVPQAQVAFWRTSDHCGDDRILPDSDSHIILVNMQRSHQQ
jgi:cephalosporin hydroxylase